MKLECGFDISSDEAVTAVDRVDCTTNPPSFQSNTTQITSYDLPRLINNQYFNRNVKGQVGRHIGFLLFESSSRKLVITK